MARFVRYYEGLVGVLDDGPEYAEEIEKAFQRSIWEDMTDGNLCEVEPCYWDEETPVEAAYARYRILRRRLHGALGGTSFWNREWGMLSPREFVRATFRYAALSVKVGYARIGEADSTELSEICELAERLLLPYERGIPGVDRDVRP